MREREDETKRELFSSHWTRIESPALRECVRAALCLGRSGLITQPTNPHYVFGKRLLRLFFVFCFFLSLLPSNTTNNFWEEKRKKIGSIVSVLFYFFFFFYFFSFVSFLFFFPLVYVCLLVCSCRFFFSSSLLFIPKRPCVLGFPQLRTEHQRDLSLSAFDDDVTSAFIRGYPLNDHFALVSVP